MTPLDYQVSRFLFTQSWSEHYRRCQHGMILKGFALASCQSSLQLSLEKTVPTLPSQDAWALALGGTASCLEHGWDLVAEGPGLPEAL